MDVDSPSSNRSDDDEEFEESGYNAELLELEPLREDSEELRDDDDSKAGQGDGGDGDDDDSEDNKQDSPGSAFSEDQEESDDDDDAHVQGLTANEREILTLLAVDKKLASLLALAADALSALRPKETPQETKDESNNTGPSERPTILQTAEAVKAFEAASSEYYKALDDIQLTLRNSIHLIRKARISPRTLMENPSLGSVLSAGLGESNADGSNERINIAPGVVPDKKAGLSIGTQRMELETWKEGVMALKGLLESLNRPITSVADGKGEQTNGSLNSEDETK